MPNQSVWKINKHANTNNLIDFSQQFVSTESFRPTILFRSLNSTVYIYVFGCACVRKEGMVIFCSVVVVIKKIAIIFVEHSVIAHDIFMSQFIPQTTKITFFSNYALVRCVCVTNFDWIYNSCVNKLLAKNCPAMVNSLNKMKRQRRRSM